MVLLTKSIGIWTPLILSIVVAVAPRLILYKKESRDRIVDKRDLRSYRIQETHEIVSYMGFSVGEWEKETMQSNVSAYEWSPTVTIVPNIPSTGKASFLELSNKLAEFIQQQSEHYLFLCLAFLLTYNFTLDFKNHPILEFLDMGNKPQDGHIMDTRCRPNITAALQGHWKGHDVCWPLIWLAGEVCNGHYNCMPDLGRWWCSEDLWLSMGAVDTRREGTRSLMSLGWLSTRTLLDTSTRCNSTWLPLWVGTLTRPLGKQMIRDEEWASSDWRRPRWRSLVFKLVLKYSSALGLNRSSNCK